MPFIASQSFFIAASNKQKIKSMKLLQLLLIQLICFNMNAQTPEPPEIADPLERAISEFYKPFDEQDFLKPIAILEELKATYPDSTVVRYFLGYAYDRLNCKDGKSIPNIQPLLTEMASEEFEFIISKSPRYNQRKLFLDPYSKIAAVWGSLALKHYYHSDLESMALAFNEGKTRGGFNETAIEIGEKVLNSCTPNAILFVSGDNFSFPIHYSQLINNYRTDVQVIDVSLLNTNWYCTLLKSTSSIPFFKDTTHFKDIPAYVISNKQVIKISNKKCQTEEEFIWEIDKLRNELYLIKGDSILKEIVIQNEFQRDIYFTKGQNSNDLLSLDKHFSNQLFVDQLSPCQDKTTEKPEDMQFTTLSDPVVKNSEDLLRIFDLYRYNFSLKITDKVNAMDFETSKQLMNEMERLFPEELVPIQDEYLKQYIGELKRRVGR